jgi:hypothetical protein
MKGQTTLNFYKIEVVEPKSSIDLNNSTDHDQSVSEISDSPKISADLISSVPKEQHLVPQER